MRSNRATSLRHESWKRKPSQATMCTEHSTESSRPHANDTNHASHSMLKRKPRQNPPVVQCRTETRPKLPRPNDSQCPSVWRAICIPGESRRNRGRGWLVSRSPRSMRIRRRARKQRVQCWTPKFRGESSLRYYFFFF